MISIAEVESASEVQTTYRVGNWAEYTEPSCYGVGDVTLYRTQFFGHRLTLRRPA